MRVRRRMPESSRHPGCERGYVMATAALVLVPLLVVSGMAIDLGGDYWQGVRMQRAADAAALAGVVWLPDLAKAQTVATDMMTKNGWPPNAGNQVTISADRANSRG